MSDLDDKLQSILEDWYPGTQYSEVIPQIKQAFEEAGYHHTDSQKFLPLLTGQEWYDRFEKELNAIFPDGLGFGGRKMIEAAKRASGLEGDASLSTD